MRYQLDEKNKKDSAFKLHGSIRQGLDSLRGISYDIAAIASPNARSSLINSNASRQTMDQMSELHQPHHEHHVVHSPRLAYSREEIDRLARLAIAEQELQRRFATKHDFRDQTGSDFVLAAVTDSILSESYALQDHDRMMESKRVVGNTNLDTNKTQTSTTNMTPSVSAPQ